MNKLWIAVFLDVRHFGGKLVLSRAFAQLLSQPPDPQGPLHIAVKSIE